MPPAHVARQVARLAAMLRLDHSTVTDAVTDALDGLAARTPVTRRDEAPAKLPARSMPTRADQSRSLRRRAPGETRASRQL